MRPPPPNFQLTIRPWILVPYARKTLIWHSDFQFSGGPDPPIQASCIRCSHGGKREAWPSGSDLRRAIALARHRAPKCCTRRVIFSAPWSTHKQTRSKESDFSLSYSSLCPPKESDLSLSCHFQNLSTGGPLSKISGSVPTKL